MAFWTLHWTSTPVGWILPLLWLAVIVAMVYVCGRMMTTRSGFGCMARHRAADGGEVEDLREQVRALEKEIRKLRAAT